MYLNVNESPKPISNNDNVLLLIIDTQCKI